MPLLLFLSAIGFLVSLISHILLLFEMNIPASEIAMGLNITMVISVSTRIFLTRNLRQENNWFWDSRLKSIAPRWLKAGTAIVFVYGLFIGILNITGMILKLSTTMTEIDGIIALRRLFVGLFSLLLSIYALELFLNLSFMILKKHQYDEEWMHLLNEHSK